MKNERLIRYGAAFTAAAALGGLSVKSIEASPFDKSPVWPNYPAGVRPIGDEMAKQKEMGEALRLMHQRWKNIILVLHAPKKPSIIGAASSPSAYDNQDLDFTMYGEKATNVAIIPQPGRVMFKPRGSNTVHEYAVFYDVNKKPLPGWEVLDINYAQQNGALDVYKIKSKKATLSPYPLAAQEAEMPAVGNSEDYGPTWVDAGTKKDLYSIWLPTNTDTKRKSYAVERIASLPTH